MRTEYQLLQKLSELKNRQKDIEHIFKNRNILVDDEYRMFISDLKSEYSTNGERIGYIDAQLKLLKT